MDNFKEDNLEIIVDSVGSTVVVCWKGRSDARDPNSTISPFLIKLIPDLVGKEVTIDFLLLEYMNSSTVSPILKMINELENHNVKSVVYYDENLKWQVASFKALKTIVNIMNNVQVMPK